MGVNYPRRSTCADLSEHSLDCSRQERAFSFDAPGVSNGALAVPPPANFLGQLTDTSGNPLVLNGGSAASGDEGLWGIGFGNGAHGAASNALFFASGINDENDGLFGMITPDGSGPAAASLARPSHGTRAM
jgi:hypothetical protein